MSSSSLMLGVWGGCKSRYNQPRSRLAQPWQPPNCWGSSAQAGAQPLTGRGWVQVRSLHTACDSQPSTIFHIWTDTRIKFEKRWVQEAKKGSDNQNKVYSNISRYLTIKRDCSCLFLPQRKYIFAEWHSSSQTVRGWHLDIVTFLTSAEQDGSWARPQQWMLSRVGPLSHLST